ncbi:unnamed protein product [Auanema sp. JU1783]|nr:unnamed protein product [Auanema sp. JU1783]
MKSVVLACVLVATVFACQNKGQTYKNGDEWTDSNAFLMTCKVEDNGAWRILVKACITPTGSKVGVNQTLVIDNVEWTCSEAPPGSISLRQSIPERADCHGGHPYGTTWKKDSFTFKCETKGRAALVECTTSLGNIPANATRDFDGITLGCYQHPQGTVSVGPVKTDGTCRDSEGKKRKSGEVWIEKGHFQKVCTDGIQKITGCMVDEVPSIIPLNDNVVLGEKAYFCEGKDGAYKFYSKDASTANRKN